MLINTCSKMLVCLTDIIGATARKFINNTDRDNLEMASLALKKLLILYEANTNLMS